MPQGDWGNDHNKLRAPKLQATSLPKGAFSCVFCQEEYGVRVTINKKARSGNLRCIKCGVTWTSSIHNLTAEVDIYTDWLDACEGAEQQKLEEAHQDKLNTELLREKSRQSMNVHDEYAVPIKKIKTTLKVKATTSAKTSMQMSSRPTSTKARYKSGEEERGLPRATTQKFSSPGSTKPGKIKKLTETQKQHWVVKAAKETVDPHRLSDAEQRVNQTTEHEVITSAKEYLQYLISDSEVADEERASTSVKPEVAVWKINSRTVGKSSRTTKEKTSKKSAAPSKVTKVPLSSLSGAKPKKLNTTKAERMRRDLADHFTDGSGSASSSRRTSDSMKQDKATKACPDERRRSSIEREAELVTELERELEAAAALQESGILYLESARRVSASVEVPLIAEIRQSEDEHDDELKVVNDAKSFEPVLQRPLRPSSLGITMGTTASRKSSLTESEVSEEE